MTRFARAHLCAATSALLLLLAGCSSAPASNAQTQLCGISDASGWDSATSQTPAKRAILQAASEIGGEAKFATGEGELDALLKGGCTIVISEGQGMTHQFALLPLILASNQQIRLSSPVMARLLSHAQPRAPIWPAMLPPV